MSIRRARALTEDAVARLEPPSQGERTIWCPALPRFGIRLRAGGAKTFVIKYRTHDGRQRKLALGTWPALPVDKARRLARQHLGDVERGQDPAAERRDSRSAPTVVDLADAYLQTKTGVKRATSLRNDRGMFETIIVPALGRKRVRDVSSADVEQLHRTRAATPYRANRVLALLSNAFAMAVRWGWRTDNPAKGVERFHEDKRERWLQGEELTRLVAALRTHPNRRASNAIKFMQLNRDQFETDSFGCRLG
jgi:hypothetical protein